MLNTYKITLRIKDMEVKELLKLQLSKLDDISLDKLGNWKTETLQIVSKIFDNESSNYKNFVQIGSMAISGYQDYHLESFRSCLNGMILCLDIPKEPQTQKNNPANIVITNTNNNSNNQTQTVTFDIKKIIEDELPPAKMRDIKEIANSNELNESKINKIGEILQKTGIEIVSSTLAKVITCSMGIF